MISVCALLPHILFVILLNSYQITQDLSVKFSRVLCFSPWVTEFVEIVQRLNKRVESESAIPGQTSNAYSRLEPAGLHVINWKRDSAWDTRCQTLRLRSWSCRTTVCSAPKLRVCREVSLEVSLQRQQRKRELADKAIQPSCPWLWTPAKKLRLSKSTFLYCYFTHDEIFFSSFFCFSNDSLHCPLVLIPQSVYHCSTVPFFFLFTNVKGIITILHDSVTAALVVSLHTDIKYMTLRV